MVLACGYKLPDETLAKMMEFLDEKQIFKLDVNTLLTAIKWYKDEQLTNDFPVDVDEYLDAFVALGGQADKEGYISKEVLVEIIKTEFELTIDMVVSSPPLCFDAVPIASIGIETHCAFEIEHAYSGCDVCNRNT